MCFESSILCSCIQWVDEVALKDEDISRDKLLAAISKATSLGGSAVLGKETSTYGCSGCSIEQCQQR